MSSNNYEDEPPLVAISKESDSSMKYSPRKLDSVVLGDGSFEALMKERSKVSKSTSYVLNHISIRR
jgi:hypothetical protein